MILLADPRCPVYELHEYLILDTLTTRRAKSMVKLILGFLHGQEPSYLLDQLKAVVQRSCVTECLQVTLPGFVVQQWNLIKVELKAAVNKI